jgi:general stress protein YciG
MKEIIMNHISRENAGGRDGNGRFTKGSTAAREAGRSGGKVSSGSFEKGSERAREAGRKGGRA